MPTNFVVPCDNTWPVETHDLKLGSIVETIRNKGTWRHKQSELMNIGFEYRSIDNARWCDEIRPGLLRYKKIYGDLLVPQVSTSTFDGAN